MTKRLPALALLLLSPLAFAHNGLQHVMGVAAKVSATSLEVKTTDGKTTIVTVDAQTRWKKGTAPATAKDVKPGDRVVVHARPASGGLQAVEVAVGAASAAH